MRVPKPLLRLSTMTLVFQLLDMCAVEHCSTLFATSTISSYISTQPFFSTQCQFPRGRLFTLNFKIFLFAAFILLFWTIFVLFYFIDLGCEEHFKGNEKRKWSSLPSRCMDTDTSIIYTILKKAPINIRHVYDNQVDKR